MVQKQLWIPIQIMLDQCQIPSSYQALKHQDPISLQAQQGHQIHLTPSPQANPVLWGLLGFSPCWQESSSDAWVLRTVSQGYSIEFYKIPPNRFWEVPISRDPVKHFQKLKASQHLLTIRAIEPVSMTQRGKGVYLLPGLKEEWRHIHNPRFKVAEQVHHQEKIQDRNLENLHGRL